MTLERLTQLINAYGSDPRRWPEAERAAAVLLLRSPEARRVQTEARALDDLLDIVVPAPAGEELRCRIQDRVHLRPTPVTPAHPLPIWYFRSWWPQAAALAAAVVLGFLIGARVLPAQSEKAVEVEVGDWLFGTGMMDGWEQ